MSFSDEEIQAVWNKGREIPNYDSSVWRWDVCGSVMKRSEYGNRNSKQGWEIDHKDPNACDQLSNLQPLQWENNVAKSDGKVIC